MIPLFSIILPYQGVWNPNISDSEYDKDYKINIEYDIEPNFECVKLDSDINECLQKNQSLFQTTLERLKGNKTVKVNNREIIFTRDFESMREFSKWSNKRFTGFEVQWNCTNCDEKGNHPQFKHNAENKHFVMIANLILEGTPLDKLWKAIKATKKELRGQIIETYDEKWTDKHYDYYISRRVNLYELFFETLKNYMNTSVTYDANYGNITDEILESAANLFIYMTAPHQKYWRGAYDFYSDCLEYLTPRMIVGMNQIESSSSMSSLSKQILKLGIIKGLNFLI